MTQLTSKVRQVAARAALGIVAPAIMFGALAGPATSAHATTTQTTSGVEVGTTITPTSQTCEWHLYSKWSYKLVFGLQHRVNLDDANEKITATITTRNAAHTLSNSRSKTFTYPQYTSASDLYAGVNSTPRQSWRPTDVTATFSHWHLTSTGAWVRDGSVFRYSHIIGCRVYYPRRG